MTAGVLASCLLAACAAGGPAPDGPGAGPLPGAGALDAPAGGAAPSATAASAPASGSVAAGATRSGRRGPARDVAPSGTDSSGGGRPVSVPRGPSTRTAPEVLAARVRPGQDVRVATVRVSAGVARVEVVRRTGPEAARTAIAAAQADPSVVAVEVDGRVHALDTGAAAVSNDPGRRDQWALDALRAESAWSVTTGRGQSVAVVDTGVEATHPDLAGRVLGGSAVVAPCGDAHSDPEGHGTHVAGIIGATAGNAIGVAGLAPGATILPVRALDADGSGWDSDIASAVLYAADRGAGVINLSLGGSDASDTVRSAVQYAIDRGSVVVAAAGNERADGNPVEYPAGFDIPGLIAVAATTSGRISADYSESGPQVTLAAPGSGIVSTYRGGRYAQMSGTSMATPYVSAAVALVRSVAPALTPAQVSQLLVSTADDLEARGRDDDTGAGLVNPVAALCTLGHCPGGAGPTSSPTTSTTTSSSIVTSSTATPATATAGPTGNPAARDEPSLPMRVQVSGPAQPVVFGQRGVVAVRVTDTGGSLACVQVTVAGGGRSVQGYTDGSGIVQLAVAPARSATWTVRASAAGRPAVQGPVAIRVVPRVTARWGGARVSVTVAPAAGQLVTVWSRGRTGWVRGARRAVTASAPTVTLAVPATGQAMVTVAAATGLGAGAATRP